MPPSTYVRMSVRTSKMWLSLKAFEVKQSWRCSIPLIAASVANPKVGSRNSHCTYLWFITKCWEVSSMWVGRRFTFLAHFSCTLRSWRACLRQSRPLTRQFCRRQQSARSWRVGVCVHVCICTCEAVHIMGWAEVDGLAVVVV